MAGKVRENALFIALFSGLTIAAAWPALNHRFLPLVDLPQHAAEIALWNAYETSATVREHYSIHLLIPYAGLYAIWHLLTMAGVSVLTGSRWMVALAVVSIPVGTLILLRCRRTPLEWSLLTFPLLYDHTLGFGFIPFYLSISVAFVAVGIFSLWLERRTPGLAIAVCGAALAVLWCHALMLGILGVLCGVLVIASPGTATVRVRAMLPLAPAGALLFWWSHGLLDQGVFPPLEVTWQKVERFSSFLCKGFTPSVLEAIAFSLALPAIAVAVSMAERRRDRTSEGALLQRVWRSIDRPLFLAAISAFALYFILPSAMLTTSDISGRFVPVGSFLLIASLPAISAPLPRRGLVLASACMALLVFFRVDGAFGKFNREVGRADRMFARLPAGTSVMFPEGANKQDTPFYLPVFSHFAAWSELWTLGASDTITHDNHVVIQDRPENRVQSSVVRIAVEANGTWNNVRMGGDRAADYILLYYEGDGFPVAFPSLNAQGRYAFADQSGGLKLYRWTPDL